MRNNFNRMYHYIQSSRGTGTPIRGTDAGALDSGHRWPCPHRGTGGHRASIFEKHFQTFLKS